MIKNYKNNFVTKSESYQITNLETKISDLVVKIGEIDLEDDKKQFDILQEAPLEPGETEQKRQKRLERLKKEINQKENKVTELEKQVWTLNLDRDAIERKVIARYTRERKAPDILKDCLQVLKEIEPSDVDMTRPTHEPFSDQEPTEKVMFSFMVLQYVIYWDVRFFSEIKDSKNLFRIMRALYERTLEIYPGEFTDQERSSFYCVFDKAFFKALEEYQNNQEPTLEGFTRLKETPMWRALEDVVKVSKRELENPNQISLFDLERQIDTWNESNEQSPNARKVTVTKKSKNSSEMKLTFAVEDYRTLLNGNASAHKLISFIAEKFIDVTANPEQNALVSISINEIADRFCMEQTNVRASIKTAEKLLQSVKYECADGYIYVFPSFINGQKTLKNGQRIGSRGHITIEVSRFFDWSEGGEFTKQLPLYVWGLNQNAWFLAHYVYSFLRHDAKNISPQQRTLNKKISLMSVLPVLNLPHPSETNRVEQLVLDPIRKVIDEINKAEQQKNNGVLSLRLDVDAQKAPIDRVTTGNLVITLKSGAYLDSLKTISQKCIDHKAESLKKKEEKEKRNEATKVREQTRLEYYQGKKRKKNGQT